MKTNSTRIVIVLDRSGSMQCVRAATISGFNEFINGQGEVAGDCHVRLVQFDDEIETVWDRPLYHVPPLTMETYVPRGNTALFDAMGETITGEGIHLSYMPEDQRPEHVIVMILTDGMENASQRYHQAQIRNMVQLQRDQYNWQFIFLGANQDAVLTAQGFGIPMQAAMTYDAGKLGVRNAFRSTTAYSNAVRMGANNVAFSSGDRAKAMEKAND